MSISFVLFSFLLFFVALSVHEASHAYVADKLGDPTAKIAGRLSLNPLAHIDPFGTIILPLLLAISGAPAFGWAKPVMIDPRNFKNPPRHNFLTALAGPVSNVLFAFLVALIARFTTSIPVLHSVLVLLVQINIILALFNILPIPPLDGSKVWNLVLSQESYYQLERMGPFILLAVIIFSFSTGNFLLNFIFSLSDKIVAILH